MKIPHLTFVLVAASVVALPESAFPQNSDAPEEIIVTARKRQESLMQSPVVETAITEQQLDQFATNNLLSVQQDVPSLNLGTAVGAFGTQVSMRGIGTTTLNITIDQSVSLNLDGLQVTQGMAYQAGMFDVNQVEVLKGPQALFYGKASPGGVIQLRSNDPGSTYEAMARVEYESEAATKKGEFILSGPVTDNLSMRLAASIGQSDGYFNNIGVGLPQFGGVTPHYGTLPYSNDYIARFTAIWKPLDNLTFRLKVNYVEDDDDGYNGDLQVTNCTRTAAYPGTFFLPTTCGISRNYNEVDALPSAYGGLRNNGIPFANTWQGYTTLETTYNLTPDYTVTSLTSFYQLVEQYQFNGTETAMAGSGIVPDNNFRKKDLTEELRVSSNYSGPFNFMVGGLVQDGQSQTINVDHGNSQFYFFPLPSILFAGTHYLNISAQSAFGQVTYKVLPDLELSAGARYSHEYRSDAYKSESPPYASGVFIPLGEPFIKSNHVDPEVSLTYTPDRDLTIYGSFKTAAKSGSFDTTLPISAPGQFNAFHDETVVGGEGGVKGYLFDRALRFNLDGYYYQYSNLQVGANAVTAAGVVETTLNAATADVHGLDVDGTYRVHDVPGLTLHGAANWDISTFSNFPNGTCWDGQTIAEGCNQLFSAATGLYTSQNLTGRPLVRAPRWSGNFGFNYARTVLNDWNLTFGSSTNYSGSYYTNLVERSDTVQHAYFKTNANVSLSTPDGQWEFSIIGNNLADVLTTGNCVNATFQGGVFGALGQSINGGTTSGPAGPDSMACNIDPGRELWLRLTWRLPS